MPELIFGVGAVLHFKYLDRDLYDLGRILHAMRHAWPMELTILEFVDGGKVRVSFELLNGHHETTGPVAWLLEHYRPGPMRPPPSPEVQALLDSDKKKDGSTHE